MFEDNCDYKIMHGKQMIFVDTSDLIDLFKGDDNDAVRNFREIIQQQVSLDISSVIY